jgi:protein O-mannosyl-transferase
MEAVAAAQQQPAAQATSGASGKRQLVVAILLVLAVALVFGQLRTHEFLNYDDPLYVTQNEHVQKGLTFDGIGWAFRSFDFNWHPVTWISHMLDVQLFGMNAGAHLLVSVALHAANAVLLFLLLTRMTGAVWRSGVVAALFAVHPLHVESVAWLAERKDVLSSLLLLLMLHSYVSWTRTRGRAAYGMSIVWLILGLMSKGMVITAPFLLLLLDVWPLRRMPLETLRDQIWPRVREKLPHFLLIVPAVILTVKAQHAVSAVVATTVVSPMIRLANAAIAYVTYLGKAFWPQDLGLPYPYGLVVSPTGAAFSAILLIAITAIAVSARRSKPYLLIGWLWYLGTLIPVIGLIQIGTQSMADRYTYIPLVGIFIALVWLVVDLLAATPALRPLVATVTAIAIVALAVAAHAQAAYWHDTFTLFEHSAAVVPDNYIAHQQLGNAYYTARQYDSAAPHYREVIRIKPRNFEAHFNLAMIEIAGGDTTGAVRDLTEALSIRQDERARAALLSLQGKPAEAIRVYQSALQKEPAAADLHNDLAAALARTGRDAEAAAEYDRALALDPALFDGHMNYGALLSRLGRNDDAVRHFTKAAALRPTSPEPLIYTALVEAGMGRNDDAIDRITRAMGIDHDLSNSIFTNAVHMPPKPTNIDDYLAFLRAQRK